MENQEQVSKTIDNIAAAIRTFRNKPFSNGYVQILTVLIFTLNSVALQKIIDVLNSVGFEIEAKMQSLNPTYTLVWAGLIVCVAILAIRERIKQLDLNATARETFTSNSPIIGLFAFDFSDAEIFKKLERNTETQNYSNAILSPNFTIGILMAPSGCGKTSLLKAGLTPILKSEKNTECIVVTFSNQNPMESIRHALQTQMTKSTIAEKSLLPMLEALPIVQSHSTLILIFDQFEQFFTQNPKVQDRTGFIDELSQVLTKLNNVKILLSIRSDFSGHLHEVQASLHYVLDTVRNYFELKKFQPTQAIRIFKYVASTENIKEEDIDEKFLQHLCKNELSGEDGLIAAANLQILLWIMKNKSIEGGLKLTERAFNQLGGLEGLLQSYIEEQLKLPNAFNKNNDSLYCLLALIDLNTNLRAGQITVNELKGRLVDTFDLANLQPILDWLENLRLVCRIESKDSETKYELAHEKLIEPIRNIENTVGVGPIKASRLLEKRTNEWLGNSRSGRYLLPFAEWRYIMKHKKLITWGEKQNVKDEYLRISSNYFKRTAYILGSVVVICLLALVFRTTNLYRLDYKASNEIRNMLNTNIDSTEPEATILDSLMKLDPEFLNQYAHETKSQNIKLSYIRIFFKKDSIHPDMSKMIKLVNSCEDDQMRYSVITAIISKSYKIKESKKVSDSLFGKLVDLYIQRNPAIYHHSKYDSYLGTYGYNIIDNAIQYNRDEDLKKIADYAKKISKWTFINFNLEVYQKLKSSGKAGYQEYMSKAIAAFQLDEAKAEDANIMLTIIDYYTENNDDRHKAYLQKYILLVDEQASKEDYSEDVGEKLAMLASCLAAQNQTNLKLQAFDILNSKNTSLDRELVVSSIVNNIGTGNAPFVDTVFNKLLDAISTLDYFGTRLDHLKTVSHFHLNEGQKVILSREISKNQQQEREQLDFVEPQVTEPYNAWDTLMRYAKDFKELKDENFSTIDQYYDISDVFGHVAYMEKEEQGQFISKLMAFLQKSKNAKLKSIFIEMLFRYDEIAISESTAAQFLKIDYGIYSPITKVRVINKTHEKYPLLLAKNISIIDLAASRIDTVKLSKPVDLNKLAIEIATLYKTAGRYNKSDRMLCYLNSKNPNPETHLKKKQGLLLQRINLLLEYRRNKNKWCHYFWD
jgi:hypothetical protein